MTDFLLQYTNNGVCSTTCPLTNPDGSYQSEIVFGATTGQSGRVCGEYILQFILQHDLHLFLTLSVQPPTSEQSSSSSLSSTVIIIIAVVGGVFLLVIVVVLLAILRARRLRQDLEDQNTVVMRKLNPKQIEGPSLSFFFDAAPTFPASPPSTLPIPVQLQPSHTGSSVDPQAAAAAAG